MDGWILRLCSSLVVVLVVCMLLLIIASGKTPQYQGERSWLALLIQKKYRIRYWYRQLGKTKQFSFEQQPFCLFVFYLKKKAIVFYHIKFT